MEFGQTLPQDQAPQDSFSDNPHNQTSTIATASRVPPHRASFKTKQPRQLTKRHAPPKKEINKEEEEETAKKKKSVRSEQRTRKLARRERRELRSRRPVSARVKIEG